MRLVFEERLIMKRVFGCLGFSCAFAIVPCEICTAGYTISNPPSGSTRGKMTTVAGTGMGPSDEAAVFRFGVWVNLNTWTYHEETAILATPAVPGMNYGPWLKDLSPPANGWRTSPQPMPGMFKGDHTAVVIRVRGAWDADTKGHVINGS